MFKRLCHFFVFEVSTSLAPNTSIVLSFAILKYNGVSSMFITLRKLIPETDKATVVNRFWCQCKTMMYIVRNFMLLWSYKQVQRCLHLEN